MVRRHRAFLQAASLLFMENSENLRIAFDFSVL